MQLNGQSLHSMHSFAYGKKNYYTCTFKLKSSCPGERPHELYTAAVLEFDLWDQVRMDHSNRDGFSGKIAQKKKDVLFG